MPVDGVGPLLTVPCIAVLALRARAVDGPGALAGVAVGAAMAAGAGWAGIAMLAALLVVGTACSPRGRRRRDALQVACNGTVPALAAVAAGVGASWGIATAAGALAAALSDTVAGEVGRRWGGQPRVLLAGRRVAVGTDGGMTWVGTVASVLAAFLVPAAGLAAGATLPLLATGLAGLAGNLADSLLGVWPQPRWGRRGNDWVNLVATAVGGTVALALA